MTIATATMVIYYMNCCKPLLFITHTNVNLFCYQQKKNCPIKSATLLAKNYFNYTLNVHRMHQKQILQLNGSVYIFPIFCTNKYVCASSISCNACTTHIYPYTYILMMLKSKLLFLKSDLIQRTLAQLSHIQTVQTA